VHLFKSIQSNQKGFNLFSRLLAAAQSGAYFGGAAADLGAVQAAPVLAKARRSHVLHGPYNLASPFLGTTTDIAAYVQAAFDLDCPLGRQNHPSARQGDLAHAHCSLEDAQVHTAAPVTQDSRYSCPFPKDQNALPGQTSSITKHNG
jgi:hypothetical protein